ncbi:MAG: phytanoyl-CoA dioxygenase family protein [Gammaproteobacteria bacterium]
MRTVSDAEVVHFRTRGWARLDALIPPGQAAAALLRAQELMVPERAAASVEHRAATRLTGEQGLTARDNPWWRDLHDVARRDPLFHAIAFHTAMAANVRRLQGIDAGVRLNIDLLTCKRARAQGPGNGPTPFHRDYPAFPFDCPLNLVFVIALDDIAPEQGAMRFCGGSHLDVQVDAVGAGTSGIEIDPALLQRFPMSEPLAYRPGDATVHAGLTIHGGPANTTGRHRWSYHVALFSDAIRYTGAPSPRFDGLGLEPGGRIDHPHFPLLPGS